jgi:hypothetical protein
MTLGSSQLPVEFWGKRALGRAADTDFHLVPKLSMCGAAPPPCYIYLRRGA